MDDLRRHTLGDPGGRGKTQRDKEGEAPPAKAQVKVQEKSVAEETHRVPDSPCERTQAQTYRAHGPGPEYIKGVIRENILLLNAPAEDDKGMLIVTWL